MKQNHRLTRINDEVRRELAEIIRSDIKDPRVSAMSSVTKADVTNDLKYCKVYISVLGSESERAAVMEGLRNAGGFIRKLLAERVNLRQTPELTFIADDSIEYGMRMSKLIDEVTSSIPAEDALDNGDND